MCYVIECKTFPLHYYIQWQSARNVRRAFHLHEKVASSLLLLLITTKKIMICCKKKVADASMSKHCMPWFNTITCQHKSDKEVMISKIYLVSEFSGAVWTCLEIILWVVWRFLSRHRDLWRGRDIFQVLGPGLGDVEHLPLGGADLKQKLANHVMT